MKVRDYVELEFHFTRLRIKSARTGKKLFGDYDVAFMTKREKKLLSKFLDWEVTSVEPFVAKCESSYGLIVMGIVLSVPEFNGEQR